MGTLRNIALSAATIMPVLVAAPAFAGPCSDQIASVSRTLSAYPNVSGAPTSGTLNGSGPSDKSTAPAPDTGAQANSTTAKGNSLTGESGNREMNAAARNTATSPEDVRRQQAGVPTMADAPNAKTPDQRMTLAAQQLDRARALDARNDPACRQAANQASQLARPD